MRSKLNRSESMIEKKLGDENLSDKERRKLEKQLNSTKDGRKNMRRWYRSNRKLERDPDNRRRFRITKRREWKMRKSL